MVGESPAKAPLILTLPASDPVLAARIQAVLPEAVLMPVSGTADIARHFAGGHPLIGLMSSGILIRAVASGLADKKAEPPVIAVSADGSAVVPLLGGHRGANSLARQLAEALSATAAITTASDAVSAVALDVPPPGWRLVNPQDYKAFASQLARCGTVQPQNLPDWAQALKTDDCSPLSINSGEPSPGNLVYVQTDLTVGVGSDRNCPAGNLAALADRALEGIDRNRIAGLYSVSLKSDEPAVLALAASLNVPVRFFSPETLREVTVKNPSDVVAAEIGTPSVAEASALRAAGKKAELVIEKMKSDRATIAVARAAEGVDGSLSRAQRGSLTLVGIGPGDAAHMTPAAGAAIAGATDLVGYGYYLDLLGAAADGKAHHARALGEETERCRLALDLALEGRSVALVCSGDPAIYAMAALVYELLDGDVRRWSNVDIAVEPGLTALQMASARSGALLGHDFCAISLSDLLTPWEVIQQRIAGAAAGDFVIAFYNPVSKKRDWQLGYARDELLKQRPGSTPVVIARQLGRPEEQVRIVALDKLDPADVDMFTVVLIGSSQSRVIDRGESGQVAFTPRGYAKKWD